MCMCILRTPGRKTPAALFMNSALRAFGVKAELGSEPETQKQNKFISVKRVTHEKLGHLLLADGDDGRRAQGRARLRAQD